MRSQSGERENRVGSYGDVVRPGMLLKTVDEANDSDIIRITSVYEKTNH